MRKILPLIASIIFYHSSINLSAQQITTVEAVNNDISNNLDLALVASLFGESESLEDFEYNLNNPATRVSNLDLDEDGEVDYLKVVAKSEGYTNLIIIRAVIGFDLYQDVATIDVEKNNNGESNVQITGDEYLYGSNYGFQLFFDIIPKIINVLWDRAFYSWHSPYSYNRYPPYYQSCTPYSTYIYQQNILTQTNNYNTYIYTTNRPSITCIALQKEIKRNDFALKQPDKSFTKRNVNYINKKELKFTTQQLKIKNDTKLTTGKKVKNDWKPNVDKGEKEIIVKGNIATFIDETADSKPTNNESLENNKKLISGLSKATQPKNTKPSNAYKPRNNSPQKSSSKKSSYKPKSTKSSNAYKPRNNNSKKSSSKKSTYKPKSTKSNNAYKPRNNNSKQSSSKKSTYKPKSTKSSNAYKPRNSNSKQSSSKKSTYKPANKKPTKK